MSGPIWGYDKEHYEALADAAKADAVLLARLKSEEVQTALWRATEYFERKATLLHGEDAAIGGALRSLLVGEPHE